MKRNRFRVALIAALGLPPAHALAQVPAPPSYTPPPPHSAWERFGQTLIDKGVFFRSYYNGDFADNPVGGLRQGADYAGEFNLGADVNMQTLAGIPGGAFHVTFTDRTGRDISIDDIGNNILGEQIYGGQSLRLSQLTWDQTLFHNRLDITIGRLNDAFYDGSVVNCNFQTNAICGHVDSLFRAVGLTAYPYAVWGGQAVFNPTKKTYVSISLSEVNPLRSAYGSHDFNFTLHGDTGLVVPVELGYRTNFSQETFPRTYKIGGYYDSSNYKDAAYNKNGGLLIDHGGVPASHWGRYGLYASVNQVIYRPDLKNTRNLRFFGGFTHSLDTPEEILWGGDAGLLDTGPFASRPLDTIGLIGTVMHFGGRELTYLKDERAAGGGHGTPAANELVFELNYGAQLTPWLRLMPNFQYVVNPDSLAHPRQAYQTPNAAIFGIQLSVNVLRLAGLPQATFSH